MFEPGAGWSYSNTNYIVAGLILERVTRRPVSQLVEQRIIRPLRLRQTSFPERSPEIRGYHAHGYLLPAVSGAGYVDWTRVSPTWAGAAGALVSNVDDVRRFYRSLLGGRLLGPAELAAMKELVPVGDDFGYGLGLYRTRTACGSAWGHDGSVPGYLTVAWNDESGRRGFSVGLPTDPDERLAAAYARLVDVASCRMSGQPVPPQAAGARSADVAPDRSGPGGVDRSPLG